MSQPDKFFAALRNRWLVLVTVFGLLLIYAVAMRTGAGFVYFGYVSYDTCWILKLGQLITQACAVPKVDPFTFTLPLYAKLGEPQPYVVYQWLAEVAFYKGYGWFGPVGLLMAAAMITVIAFLSIPLRACVKANAPPLWSYLSIAAASIAANVRSYIRPEVFSCLYLALWLVLLQRVRLNAEKNLAAKFGEIDYKTIVALTVMMGLWCNTHTAFVSGIIVLFIYAAAYWLDDIVGRRSMRGVTKTLLIALATTFLASLCNPHGFGLWAYLPHLYFAPVNEQVQELKALTILELSKTWYFPITILLLLTYLGITVRIFRSLKAGEISILGSPARLSAVAIVIAATIICLLKRRLVSVASLLIVFETANFIGRRDQPSQWPSKLWHSRLSFVVLEVAILILAPLGVHDIARVVQICIPQLTEIFVPPLAAMAFFTKNYQGGRIFSGLEISNMLELYLYPRNSLFMDTRLDAFSEKIREHFETIILGRRGWKQLLDHYAIEWVFVTRRDKLGPLLELDPDWQEVYQDPTAMIFKRVHKAHLPRL
jgi:hypothetical protein